ncbi:MAG: hypothetical protein Q9207_004272 [Kuettlingeria erythrocarpa]
MAPKKGSRAPGAARVGGIHVKTGCVTCNTGRKCDGYVQQKSLSLPIKKEQQDHFSRAAAGSVMSLGRPNPTTWNGTIDELRGFDYFRVQTSEDLAYSLNSSLEELVLQASHHHQAIKHAAIALGSLGETIRINSSDARNAAKSVFYARHDFACAQYYKAIKLLQDDIGRRDQDSVNFALISCFLFIVFEFLQGNDLSAVIHLRSGLNILRQQGLPSRSTNSCTSVKPVLKLHPIQAEISRIFQTLDTQANMWLDLRTLNPMSKTALGSPMAHKPVPESFTTLDEAWQDLHDIISRVYNFRRFASKHDFAPSREQVPASVYANRDGLLDELEVHRRRLGNYLACRQNSAHNHEDPHRIAVLRINRKVTTLMLATYLEPHESTFYAQSQPHFWQIVSLATLILRPNTSETRQRLLGSMLPSSAGLTTDESTPRQRKIFAFFAGLIQPLYFTAIKCPDQNTARKAVELLEMESWREGSWDSAAMARIARRRMQKPDCTRWSDVIAGGTTVDEAEEGLSIEWPLATDPLITYPA